MGLVGGIVAGVAMAGLLGVFALRYQVNQVVLGVVLIALATGLTDFLLSQIPDDPEIKKYLNEPLILEKVPISGLVDIPVLGPALFNQTILVYIMYALGRLRDPAAVPDHAGGCGSARSASTPRPPTRSASTSTGSAGRPS